MRTIAFTLVLIASMACFAQNNLMETRNRLQRESQTAQATWITTYNLAYVDILMTFRLEDDALKFRLLDEAEGCLQRLSTMPDADKSEVEALKALRYLSLMNINPAINGPKYANHILLALGKALKQNPDNPRAVLLSAMYQKNQSAFMNRKYEEYDAEMARAKELLQQQDTTGLAPVWGLEWCGR